VLTAENGIEALDLYKLHQEEIALVFCDMVLPRLGGLSLFLQLREINPKVKVIFTSGYLDAGAKRNLMNVGAIDFIEKPYTPEKILNSIRAALNNP
jgi:DNA-binding NtrC family response regulator